MRYLKSVVVEGFRGRPKYTFDFSSEVNFLIGINGTGKTTLMRLIEKALRGDNSIQNEPFKSLLLTFDGAGSSENLFPSSASPQILIERVTEEFSPDMIQISYRDDQASEFASVYETENPLHIQHVTPSGLIRRRRRRKSDYYRLISELQVIWFSVQRYRYEPNDDYEEFPFSVAEEVANPIDSRLSEAANSAASYLSSLDANYKSIMDKFQEDYLSEVARMPDRGRLQISDDNWQSALEKMVDIHKNLNIDSSQIAAQISEVGSILDQGIGSDEVNYRVAQSTLLKINSVITQWEAAQSRILHNFRPKLDLIKIVNSFLSGKKLEFLGTNLPVFKLDDGTKHGLSDLSSGEKQLLIFLFEAFVLEGKSCIYLADEPELSLHVVWQEKLVNSIRTLNPAAQIIFATHSPDIVGDTGGKVFDLGRV